MRQSGFLYRSIRLLAPATAALFALAPLPACTPASEPDGERIVVVTTIAPLADFVRQVGGDRVRVTLMVPSGADPHHYEPTPRQMVDIASAAAYCKVGSGIEFELEWMDNLAAQNPAMAIVDCSAGIEVHDGDPHVWTSPRNAKIMIENILSGLSLVDPAGGTAYAANGLRYSAELAQLDSDIASLLSAANERHFLIYHPSFSYLARDYDLVQLPIEEEGKAPTPHLLQECVDRAVEHHLQYVYVAPQSATSEAQSIAEAIGGELLYVDPLPGDYLSAMRATAAALALEFE